MLLNPIRLGVGTWAWGDRLVWHYGNGYDRIDIERVFERALLDRIRFFSTSESFSEGRTESLLGELLSRTAAPVIISSKYLPRPWRMRREDFRKALKDTLTRLKRQTLDIYQIMPPVGPLDLTKLAECAAEALDAGQIREIGVSNFTLQQLDSFNEMMKRFGFSISCLETEYNLLCRDIETNGIMNFCRDAGIRIIAQNPLAMGYLTGKYDALSPCSGNRRQLMAHYITPSLELLLRTMNNVGSENDEQTCAQVALNWLICKGVLPIPGAKTYKQVQENDSAQMWFMTEEQIELLDSVSEQVKK